VEGTCEYIEQAVAGRRQMANLKFQVLDVERQDVTKY